MCLIDYCTPFLYPIKMIRSFNTSQTQIIKDIIQLHIPTGRFDLDPTYSKGNFYKSGEVLEPVYKFDKNPVTSDVVYSDSKELPLLNETVSSIIYDPPFIIAGGVESKIKARFSSYPNWELLKQDYYNSLKEFYRVLSDKGVLVVKCQNTISSGKQHQTAYFVIKSALELGYNVKDEFILLSNKKMHVTVCSSYILASSYCSKV